MQQDIPWRLLEKHFANKANKREIAAVDKWKNKVSENVIIYEQLETYFNETGSLPLDFTPDTKAALNKLAGKIGTIPIAKRVKLFPILWRAAAVFLLIAGSYWFVNNSITKHENIVSSVFITDTARSAITLSDSSRVWLNAGSAIKYPEKFSETREVYLEGEAYFEIAPDPNHPFIVNAGKTQTCVLGTKFDIRSYPSENQVAITVTHGKVRFGTSENNQVILIPGQKGKFVKSLGNVERAENNDPNFMAWKTLEFRFDGQPLETIVRTLSEVYQFKYKFDSNILKTRLLTASFLNRPLAEILETISVAADVKITDRNGLFLIQ